MGDYDGWLKKHEAEKARAAPSETSDIDEESAREQQLAMLAEARRVCVRQARSGLRSPSSSLVPHLRCVRALRSLEPELAKLGLDAEDKLVQSASGRGPWRNEAGLFGLGFASPSAPVLEALMRSLGVEGRVAGLEALSTLGRKQRAVVLERAGRTPAQETPAALLDRQWLLARLAPSPEPACGHLAEVALGTDFELQRRAQQALEELGPRCASLTARLLAAGSYNADRALGAMGIGKYALVRKEQLARGERGQQLSGSLEAMVDADWLLRTGTTAFVLDHPTALGTLARPVVKRGPCPAERLGTTAKELASWPWVPVCALEVRATAELIEPLVPW